MAPDRLQGPQALRPRGVGLVVPEISRLSVGFPSKRGLSAKNLRIGECWHAGASKDGVPQIYISPLLEDGARVLDVLLHEMIHASGIKGHRADFRRPALALGLTGKMTETVATPELTQRLNAILGEIGSYPHVKLEPSLLERKKQGTRMLKAECECGALIRCTRKVVEDPGLPTCACGGQFELST